MKVHTFASLDTKKFLSNFQVEYEKKNMYLVKILPMIGTSMIQRLAMFLWNFSKAHLFA